MATITKKQFAKETKIYKSHSLKNGMISITYAHIFKSGAISTQKTVIIEKNGGALNSLYKNICG